MSAALIQGARGATETFKLWFEDLEDPRLGEAVRAAGGIWILDRLASALRALVETNWANVSMWSRICTVLIRSSKNTRALHSKLSTTFACRFCLCDAFCKARKPRGDQKIFSQRIRLKMP